MLKMLRRRAAREDGSVAFEFLLWFPIFLMIFIWAVEGAVLMARATMFERAIDLVARDIRLGQLVDPNTGTVTEQIFLEEVCRRASVGPNCTELVSLEMLPVDTDTWAGIPFANTTAACVSRGGNGDLLRPVTEFQPSLPSQLLVVRGCALTRVLMRSDSPNPFVYTLPTDDAGGVYVTAVTAFVVEPPG